MQSKPYHDAREQRVMVDVGARTPEEETRRMYGIDAIEALANAHGTTRLLAWILHTPPDPVVQHLVREFGVELCKRWVGYYSWREPRYPSHGLRRQVLSQVKETKQS